MDRYLVTRTPTTTPSSAINQPAGYETNIYDAGGNRRRTTVGSARLSACPAAHLHAASDAWEYASRRCHGAAPDTYGLHLDATYLNEGSSA